MPIIKTPYVKSVSGKTGDVTLTNSDVGLSNVTNNTIPVPDVRNNTTLSPTIFIPSGTGKFEKALSVAGAVLDGVTDDSTAFQTALDAMPTGRISEYQLPPDISSIKFNSGITIYANKHALMARGTVFDFSGMTSGTAITIDGGDNNNTYGQCMAELVRAHIVGPGRTSSVDGIKFTGSGTSSPNQGSARFSLRNCRVRNFRKGVTWFNRSYGTTLFNCEVHSNGVGYHVRGGAYDAYENQGVVRGGVFNNDINIYMEDGMLTLFGTSVDYAEYLQIAGRVGTLTLNDCHVEYAIRNGNYGGVGGIYSTNAPLAAFDLAPALTSALRTDLDLNSTTQSGLQNWIHMRMNGG
ncbi:MAG TPA: hypothetical protein VFM18_00425, partial [Methanosarcina sp.]|nr:hypothetical protein [Methanosarcina sp.]